MDEQEQKELEFLVAICLGASGGTPSAAVDNAMAIRRIVRERFPADDERDA